MSQEQKQFTFHLYVFSGRALFYLAIARDKGHKSRLILIQVFAYRWQGTMNFRFYQLSLPRLIILETIIFKEKGNIQGVHFNFRTVCIKYIHYRVSLAQFCIC